MLAGIVSGVLAAALGLGAESLSMLVEDWAGQPEGKRGIPEGWKAQTWGTPQYDFTVIADGAAKVLHLRSRGDNSTISKEVRIDVRQFPLLVWRWKVTSLPRGGDSRRKEADDQAAQIYVAFPRFPTAVRSRIIGYVWDATAPAGTIVRSESTRTVTYVIVRSGPADLGRWIVETRNVHDDYRSIYGGVPTEDARVVSVGIDSNDTRSSAESYVGEISFRRP